MEKKKISVVEITMLRWTYDKTRNARIRNEYIRAAVRLAQLQCKVMENQVK